MTGVQTCALPIFPLVAAKLKVCRELPPEELGLRVQSPDGQAGYVAAWAVEARGEKGQVKRVIVTLAVDSDGKRRVAWEREPEKLWQGQPAPQHGGQGDTKLAVLRETLEPMLRRELEHRGLAKESRGFEAPLIGWVESVA